MTGAASRVDAGPAAVGIDVGGTKILAVAAGEAGEVLAEQRVASQAATSSTLDAMAGAGRAVLAQAGGDAGGAVPLGLAVAGLVEAAGTVRSSAHLPWLAGVDLAAEMEGRLGRRRVTVANDATAAMLAELRSGAARGASDALLVTLGTGIGMGIVCNGQAVEGARGFAGEPGHMVVVPGGEPCPCGRKGCWERYASGTALARIAREAAAAGRAPGLVRLAGAPGAVTGEHVAAVGPADPGAGAVMGELAGWVALGLSNLVAVLDPALIILGGGLLALGDWLLGSVREAFSRELAPAGGDHAGDRPAVPIVAAALGERSGALGAAAMALGRGALDSGAPG